MRDDFVAGAEDADGGFLVDGDVEFTDGGEEAEFASNSSDELTFFENNCAGLDVGADGADIFVGGDGVGEDFNFSFFLTVG